VTRRTKHLLAKARDGAHIQVGLAIAVVVGGGITGARAATLAVMPAPRASILSRQITDRAIGCESSSESVRYWNSLPKELPAINTQAITRAK